jgi:hypothetical protein
MHARLTSFVLAVVVAGGASTPATQNLPQGTAAMTSTRVVSGMRAYVDPATGALTPDPAPGTPQREPLVPGLVPDDSKLEFLELPDGTKGVLFHGQRQATVIATLAADGSVQTKCVESTAALQIEPSASKPKSHRD